MSEPIVRVRTLPLGIVVKSRNAASVFAPGAILLSVRLLPTTLETSSVMLLPGAFEARRIVPVWFVAPT